MGPSKKWSFTKTKSRRSFIKETIFSIGATKGVRSGTRAYLLDTERKYPNLTIKTNTHVTRVIFKPKDKRKVTGAEYQMGRNIYEASAFYNTWRSSFGRPGYVLKQQRKLY